MRPKLCSDASKTGPKRRSSGMLLDQLRVGLIELALFVTVDELLDLGCVSGGKVVVVFYKGSSEQKQKLAIITRQPATDF